MKRAQRSSLPVKRFRIPPDHRLFGVRGQNVVHANQEAHYYNSGFTQGANEADGAGPASSDEEETGPTTPNPFSDSTGAGF